ncbi:MAG: hypothetical protein K2I29_06170 [Clostridia bacterium]|nr:hypothetical protein [Clostridia bacterium]
MMTFKEYVEDAFGLDADERVPTYIKEQFDGIDEKQLFTVLYEKCANLKKEFLLYEDDTFIGGVYGWNLYINIYQLLLPEEPADWTAYLYNMTVMAVISGLSDNERKALTEYPNNILFRLSQEYYVESGYESLTQKQWLDELAELLEKSKKRYIANPGNSSQYHRAMEENYPKFERILNFLTQDVGECEVVRMNKPNDDVTVWSVSV